ncbi:hypothetical protein DFJ67_6168 [Asanoa ferruginea]|uniref:Uncharacterized protein n=1 Tax=Asanoa ferruginea TaxID=53367 RepID=A0A3E0A1H9_9ACTN|nr:hypothetical protein [Asanoa ferruginea]REG00121.1 hypothetical protein DFJ67_6168 [Asanoa ferruginea]GIF46186.1 hypothetical protein Afe04nite_07250 [Asanoa ferruginea]
MKVDRQGVDRGLSGAHLTIAIAPIAGRLTALAGDVAVNSADSDMLFVGYPVGWLVLAVTSAAPSQAARPGVAVASCDRAVTASPGRWRGAEVF